MRHLVYLLLVANLVYLGWNMFHGQAGGDLVRQLPPLPATARPLVTLQELQQQQDAQRRVQQEPEAQQESDVQGTSSEDPEEEDVAAVVEAPEQAADPEVINVMAVEALTQAEPPGAGVSMMCQSLGPFLATEQLEEVAERLGVLGLETRQRSAETRKESGWWVYLPAMPHAEAKKVMQLLDDNNDREYYLGKDNFISLGTFGVLQRAERRLQSAQKLGLEPLLEARHETQATHWLDLRVMGAPGEELAWLAKEYPELQLEQQACR